MTKVVLRDSPKSKGKTPIQKKKIYDASSGKFINVPKLNADSETFGIALQKVFKRNVAEARKANSKILGGPGRGGIKA